jgi:lipoate-protein ligase A
VLQHGSILLRCSRHAPELPGVCEISRVDLAAEAVRSRWLEMLTKRLGLRFTPSKITPMESQRAEAWQADRFATSRWTEKR